MITERQGNIVDDDADVLVCTTNCYGAMGKGVALEFKKKWPKIITHYRNDCHAGILKPGSCRFYQIPEAALYKRNWVAFCTKDHWHGKSQYDWIATGLTDLFVGLALRFKPSIALPKLGCGKGGLDWDQVKPMMYDILEDLPDVRIYV